MSPLSIIVDSIPYVKSEIYHSQLCRHLERFYEVRYLTVDELSTGLIPDAPIVSLLRFRMLVRDRCKVSQALGNRRLLAFDYDPWEFNDDNSVHKGGYEKVASDIQNVVYCVPNVCWGNVIRSHGHSVHTFRIGVEPSMCDAGNVYRPTPYEFRGSSYPSRDRRYTQMLAAGFPDYWNRTQVKPHDAFLRHLSSNVNVWIQNDSEDVVVDGVPFKRNSLMPKAIEVLARGCFIVRDYQPESESYDIDKMPTAFMFRSLDDGKKMLDNVLSIDPVEAHKMRVETVEMIRKYDYFADIARSIDCWYYDAKH